MKSQSKPNFRLSWFTSYFGRVTTSGRLVPEIDALRFIAIASVVLYHSYGVFLPPRSSGIETAGDAAIAALHTGWFGVQLFFVISGFILSIPFASYHLQQKPKPNLKNYFIRRVTRLEPPYIINLTVLFVIMLASNHQLSEIGLNFLATLTYTHSWFFDYQSPINYVTWSLAVEVQFYIVAPLLATIFAVSNPRTRRALMALIILASTFQGAFFHSEFLKETVLGQIGYFMLGFLLADIYLHRDSLARVRSWAWDGIGILAWIAIPMCIEPRLIDYLLSRTEPDPALEMGTAYFLRPPFILLAYLAAFRGRLLNCLFRASPIVVIGGMCYTIYLYHPFILHVVRYRVFPSLKPSFDSYCFGAAACTLTVLLVVCCALFLITEKPFMYKDWPHKAQRGFRRLLKRRIRE